MKFGSTWGSEGLRRLISSSIQLFTACALARGITPCGLSQDGRSIPFAGLLSGSLKNTHWTQSRGEQGQTNCASLSARMRTYGGRGAQLACAGSRGLSEVSVRMPDERWETDVRRTPMGLIAWDRWLDSADQRESSAAERHRRREGAALDQPELCVSERRPPSVSIFFAQTQALSLQLEAPQDASASAEEPREEDEDAEEALSPEERRTLERKVKKMRKQEEKKRLKAEGTDVEKAEATKPSAGQLALDYLTWYPRANYIEHDLSGSGRVHCSNVPGSQMGTRRNAAVQRLRSTRRSGLKEMREVLKSKEDMFSFVVLLRGIEKKRKTTRRVQKPTDIRR
ncbi:hypothetical protein SKAU_G00129630 [Synaphobranchus kaupii]|uniref:Uncharacterized protein n=1 Tax=Synaphobranchus kaupii TaxID=118154 RepID=A0A9Q1FQ99_SYNKA|nr:hypothetical protein SKAU_G00129630 [Synaphobranchus kaupii]